MFSDDFEALASTIHNVCVIGAGPVGIVVALELARRGQSVTLLELGDFSRNPAAQQLSAARLPRHSRHADMTIAIERSFGGTSNLWGAGCIPLDAIDFEARDVGPLCEWPIAYDELARHFAEAARYASCGGPIFEKPLEAIAGADERFTATRLIRYASPASFRDAHRKEAGSSRALSVHAGITVTDLRFADDGRVAAAAARRRDGRVVAVRARAFVVACGGIETARLLLAVQRGAPARFGGPDGPLGRFYMGHLSGQIAAVTLDAAVAGAFDFQLGHVGRYYRRRFTAGGGFQKRERLTNISMWPVMPPLRDASHSDPVLSLAYLVLSCKPLGRMIVSEYLRRSNTGGRVDLLPHAANIVRDLPGILRFIPRFLRGRFLADPRLPGLHVANRGSRFSLHYHAEHLPNRLSRVSLAGETDALGMPRAYIDMRFSDADVDPILRTHEHFAAWLARNRLGRLDWLHPRAERAARVLAQTGDGVHQIGTARMAETPRTGVVDGDCRVFGSPNLFIAGSAVFPTSGQANPTFSAIALSVRLARLIGAEARRHDAAV